MKRVKALTIGLSVLAAGAVAQPAGHSATDPLIASVYRVKQPRGLIVTTGGWAYCEQARPIAPGHATPSSAGATGSMGTSGLARGG